MPPAPFGRRVLAGVIDLVLQLAVVAIVLAVVYAIFPADSTGFLEALRNNGLVGVLAMGWTIGVVMAPIIWLYRAGLESSR